MIMILLLMIIDNDDDDNYLTNTTAAVLTIAGCMEWLWLIVISTWFCGYVVSSNI